MSAQAPQRRPPAGGRRFEPSFEYCLAASLAAHLAFFVLGGRFHLPSFEGPPPVEIDLTSPLPGNGMAPKLGAPKRLVPNAPPVAPKPVEAPIPENIPKLPPQPPKDWTLPGPNTKKVLPAPPPTPTITPGGAAGGTGTAAIPGGHGAGFNYGDPNGSLNGGSPNDVLPPRLLNRDDLGRIMRQFYPEDERRAGHEGSVYLYVHIGADGAVSAADVKISAGASFDAAARKVAKLMRFAPATRQGSPVAVVIAAPIVFKLKD